MQFLCSVLVVGGISHDVTPICRAVMDLLPNESEADGESTADDKASWSTAVDGATARRGVQVQLKETVEQLRRHPPKWHPEVRIVEDRLKTSLKAINEACGLAHCVHLLSDCFLGNRMAELFLEATTEANITIGMYQADELSTLGPSADHPFLVELKKRLVQTRDELDTPTALDATITSFHRPSMLELTDEQSEYHTLKKYYELFAASTQRERVVDGTTGDRPVQELARLIVNDADKIKNVLGDALNNVKLPQATAFGSGEETMYSQWGKYYGGKVIRVSLSTLHFCSRI